MEDFLSNMSPSSLWLSVGVFLIFLEIVVFSGIGLLFAGLAAVSVGAALIAGWIDNQSNQFILFFLSSAVWTFVLWKPLKKFLAGKESGFDDMVGSKVVVYEQPIKKGKTGKVKWSGAIMNCQFEPETGGIETIFPDTEAVISKVSNGVLIIKEKSSNN
jgi:membrane protein implicated in regulation of membrane protease activity|tara:strand:+ start:52 stop:528 length:477 start_codon:yes stop_codon:yes gene_type:complete